MRRKPSQWLSGLLCGGLLLVSLIGCTSGHYVFHEGVEWVKLVQAKSGGPWDHPRKIAPEAMKTILQSIRYSKKIIFLKDIEHASLLGDESVSRFAPYLSMALNHATPGQEVAFSVIVKDPKLVVFRNDRLTTGRAFVKGDELVISFEKLNAKLLGDYANTGKEAQAVRQAQSIHTALELGPGQKGSYDDPDTILFDLNYPWEQGEKSVAAAKSSASQQPVIIVAPKNEEGTYVQNPKTRLKELKKLLDDELITPQEYDQKRQEILKGL